MTDTSAIVLPQDRFPRFLFKQLDDVTWLMTHAFGSEITHTQLLIDDPDGAKVSIDVGMVDLLQLLWANGIHTFFSCQGFLSQKPELAEVLRPACIVFKDPMDAQRFADIVRNTAGEEVLMRFSKKGVGVVEFLPSYLPKLIKHMRRVAD